LYGDPPKPKQQDRTIALAAANVKEADPRTATTQTAGREFSVVRNLSERREITVADRESPAMLYLLGRAPLHLALERFDAFDGRTWTRSRSQPTTTVFDARREGDKTWIEVASRTAHDLVGTGGSDGVDRLEPFAIKLIRLNTNRIPSPPQTCAVHIDRLENADFLGLTEDGSLAMTAREQIPALTVVHLRARQPSLDSLRQADFRDAAARMPDAARYLIPPPGNDVVQATAEEWLRGVPRGWRQVETIVERLRSEFVADTTAVAPTDCDNVVAHFLNVKRGPDYLFATTAAALLRSQGYPVRFVAGLYARDERFDHRARQTAVLAEDVHVWIEVAVDSRRWIAVEPTPGFVAPAERFTWSELLVRQVRGLISWLRRHLLLSVAIVLMVAAAWRFREAIADAAFQFFVWLGSVRGGVDRRVIGTVRLLEWRARRVGYARPAATTLSGWYGRLGESLPPEVATELRRVLQAAERLFYAPPKSNRTPDDVAQLNLACDVVRRQLGTARMRAAFLAVAPASSTTATGKPAAGAQSAIAPAAANRSSVAAGAAESRKPERRTTSALATS
ncbi:MAG TPA: transglutaminase-like domain-containing protein, partial [Pirellulaceae bacterium]|nr:transglutaminase-like domain-containing protein [Pirellulaceae bacterium]